MSRLALVDEGDQVVGKADYDQVHFNGLYIVLFQYLC
jgi:hypothetical protein